MTDYTYATVIIAAADQVAAQAEYPDYFAAGYYEATEGADPAVATNYATSGPFSNQELTDIINNVTWQRKVYFGDTQTILASLNLKPIEAVPGQWDPVPMNPSGQSAQI